ncbi:hypothetical protein REPUB_Repub13aG0195100 [Reevesia pubescens]
MNVDESSRGQSGLATVGGVLRDEHELWIIWFSYRIGIAYILTVELWVIFQGLSLCWKKGCRTYSLIAVQKINQTRNIHDPHFHPIKAIRELQQ